MPHTNPTLTALPTPATHTPSHLTSGNWLDSLPAAVRNDIVGHFSYQHFSRGEVIYQRYSEANKVYQIIAGEVRITNYSEDGREHLHIIFQKGEGFGDMEVLDGLPRGTAAVANAKTEVGVLDKADFFKLRTQYRELDATLLLLYCHRLRKLMGWSEDAGLELSQRIARRLHSLGIIYGRKSSFCEHGMDVSVTQEDLARMLGVARQSVGKELKEMECRGILKTRYGTITLFDYTRLGGNP